jgi:hypothetical protein
MRGSWNKAFEVIGFYRQIREGNIFRRSIISRVILQSRDSDVGSGAEAKEGRFVRTRWHELPGALTFEQFDALAFTSSMNRDRFRRMFIE